jgi:hypothetical protein
VPHQLQLLPRRLAQAPLADLEQRRTGEGGEHGAVCGAQDLAATYGKVEGPLAGIAQTARGAGP